MGCLYLEIGMMSISGFTHQIWVPIWSHGFIATKPPKITRWKIDRKTQSPLDYPPSTTLESANPWVSSVVIFGIHSIILNPLRDEIASIISKQWSTPRTLNRILIMLNIFHLQVKIHSWTICTRGIGNVCGNLYLNQD